MKAISNFRDRSTSEGFTSLIIGQILYEAMFEIWAAHMACVIHLQHILEYWKWLVDVNLNDYCVRFSNLTYLRI